MTLRRIIAFAGIVVAVTGCRHQAGFDADAFHWTNQLPNGARVHLRNGAGNIIVKRRDGASVAVSGTRQWRRSRPSDLRFVVSQMGDDYYVCAMWRSSGRCGPTGYRGRHSNGLLTMFSLFHRTNDAEAGLVAEVPAGILVDASTMNGTVDVSGVTSGLVAHSINGNVRAANVTGPLTLSTTNGNVSVTADALSPSDSVFISTVNGSIVASLPASTQGYFDLSVVNGSVHSDFPLEAGSAGAIGRHLKGQVGGLNRSIRMQTINGGLSVTTRGASASQ